ncbi:MULTISPECIES: hypothetical protein [Pontibacillus]|uniref:TMhelix containing protein n=1 Tax=Pontibacillus chungwhensis TaxID=265426 RepID=A0ABY8V194_9BACI|nr:MULTISPECIES: hypothetical protein [Pontibacillus]MCD5324498.1 hypothetical protein [Pontibacillus sp. HN14]WIF99208.1 hypothetical protein QNI29_05990 [Pontibacillus chungwhensis]
MKTFLFYLMIVLTVVFAVSFFYSILTAGSIPIIDGAATIVCAWNAHTLRKNIREQANS